MGEEGILKFLAILKLYFETYTRYSWIADVEQKKKVSGVLISNFETYTRYSWVADKDKKKVSSVLIIGLWVVLLEGALDF